MRPDTSLDALAARWAARPEPGVFAALAEGLHKRGDLAGAARVVATGLARFPGHSAGLVAQARIAVAMGDTPLATRALAVLLERDVDHPVARELAAEWAPGLLLVGDAEAEPLVTDPPPHSSDPPDRAPEAPPAPAHWDPLAGSEEPPEAIEPFEPTDGDVGVAEAGQEPVADAGEPDGGAGEAPPIVTESLAALYHRQGHLEEALSAYAELAARDPSNDTIAARREAVRRELVAHRPLPFDSRASGGESVAAWLGRLAAARPRPGAGPAAFDAFFEPPPAPPDATADFDAFQRWLQELSR